MGGNQRTSQKMRLTEEGGVLDQPPGFRWVFSDYIR
jgi:hypothetical protein